MKNDCVFCDRTQFEERLISENQDFYVIATLGQITNGGYTLLFPKNHVPCLGAADRGLTSEMIIAAKKICRALSLQYQHSDCATPYPVTLFEHGIVGQTIKHAHLHFLPTVIDLTPRIRADFPTAEIEELQYAAHLQELYRKRQEPYLYWSGISGKAMVLWNPPAPLQYLRTVAAELLGRPERANWRKMDPELDKQLWTETVARLKPYFSRLEK